MIQGKLNAIQEQINFVLAIIDKDLQHYDFQLQHINKWLNESISLTVPDIILLEELKDEYRQKALEQASARQEIVDTFSFYKNLRLKV